MHVEDSKQPTNSITDWILSALLVAATWLLYLQTSEHGFIWYDDPSYLVENAQLNQGFSWAGIRWAFTEAHSANWHPLTWLSHMLDCELFGLDAGKHHLVSVGIHSLNALLAFWVLRLASGARWPSAICAALFALHPLRVQSVAWASERKDLLAGLFFFLCLLAYLRYARRPSKARYAWVLLSLALGLMSKPMLVTMPVVLLLFDFWPLGRLESHSLGRLVREKLPLFALVLLSIVVTILAQEEGGAFRFASSLPFADRLPHAASSTLWYVRSSLWPSDLACFYPHPALVDPDWQPWVRSLLPVGLGILGLGAAVRLRSCCPQLLFGLLWMLCMLAPVIGIVQVGEQAWADRYAYLPTLGLYVAIVWPLAKLSQQRGALRAALGGLALLVLLGAGLVSHRELAHWRDTESLAGRALQVTEDNYVAHLGLGHELLKRGDLEGAEQAFEASQLIRPENTDLTLAFSELYKASDRLPEAIALYEAALERHPKWSLIRMRLGIALAQSDRPEEAIEQLELAREWNQGSLDLDYNLALSYLQAKRPEDALPLLNHCLERAERFFEARIARGEAQLQLKNYAAAKRDLLRGARVAPDKAAARLALLLASAPIDAVRDGEQALEWAARAVNLQRDASALEALAAAQAEFGRFDAARATQQEALGLLTGAGRNAAKARLDAYAEGKPYRLPR